MNRRQWYTFAALQLIGCALPFVVGHDSELAVIIAMILLLPGSLVAGLVVGLHGSVHRRLGRIAGLGMAHRDTGSYSWN